MIKCGVVVRQPENTSFVPPQRHTLGVIRLTMTALRLIRRKRELRFRNLE
nr:MAG TPA: hypothetical protein [Caudoviricetes sp.]